MKACLLFSLALVSSAVAQTPIAASPAPVPAPALATISVEGIARVDGPVWLHVELPPPLVVFYPVIQVPWVFWCDEVEVRKDDKLLTPIDLPKIPVVLFGTFGCPGNNADFKGHPPPFSNRLPLHLQYHFAEPGVYEVRYERYADGKGTPHFIRFQSAWTPILVVPAEPHRIPDPPDGREELERDFLPNLLAGRDDAALTALVTCLYQRDSFIRQYANNALHYWPDAAVDDKLEEMLRTRGPTPQIVERFKSRGADFLETALPHLTSDNEVIVQGAVEIASRALSDSSTLTPQQRSRVEDKLIVAIRRFPGFDAATVQRSPRAGGPDLLIHSQMILDLVQGLRDAASARIHEALWWLLDRDIGAPAALIGILDHPDSQDLARITGYLIAKVPDGPWDSTPSLIHKQFGNAALPALRTVMEKAQSATMREACARELGLAGTQHR